MTNRWDVYRVDFGKPIGHEPAKERPAVVVSYDDLNHNTPYVSICPITSTRRRLYGCEVRLPAGEATAVDSIIQVQLVRTIDARRLRDLVGQLRDPNIQRSVDEALRTLFALGAAT